jgi:hypothetical protein
MNETQLIRAIKAHIAKGDRAAEKSEQHYIAAGQYLKQLKDGHSGSWEEWEELLKTKVGIGKSRASELMQIADGRKTVKGVRSETNQRKMQHRESSPLRNGESSPFRNGEEAAEEQALGEQTPTDGDSDETIWRRGLLYRAKAAVAAAEFENWSGYTVDPELLQGAWEAARAWDKLARYLEELYGGSAPAAALKLAPMTPGRSPNFSGAHDRALSDKVGNS